MGVWNLATTNYNQVVPGVTPTQPGTDQYSLAKTYLGSEDYYDKSTFKSNIQEAKNLGLQLPKDVEKAFYELNKNGEKWFSYDGSLNLGLSDKDARKAKEYRRTASQYIQKITPEPQENVRARWAARNYIVNGFDTSAAQLYSGITDYNLLANLWGGNIKGALSGGYYGNIALANEQAYYNTLTAPLKRAYLLQRKLWVDLGLIKPYTGVEANNLQIVTQADMQNYMRDHINDWQYGFYGNNGYDDEYELVHNNDNPNANLYALYGISPTSSNGAWVPKGTIRISGITPTKVKEIKQKISTINPTADSSSTSKSNTGDTGSAESARNADGTGGSIDSLVDYTRGTYLNSYNSLLSHTKDYLTLHGKLNAFDYNKVHIDLDSYQTTVVIPSKNGKAYIKIFPLLNKAVMFFNEDNHKITIYPSQL